MTTTEVRWSRYSAAYDVMAANNPAYQEIVSRCVAAVRGWPLRPGARVLDAGAGTGNFSIPFAESLPRWTVSHLEPDAAMCAVARGKAAEAGVENLEVLQCDLDQGNFLPGSMNSIVYVHMLNALGDPQGASRLLAK